MKRIYTRQEATEHFYRSAESIVLELENGCRLCYNMQDVIEFIAKMKAINKKLKKDK